MLSVALAGLLGGVATGWTATKTWNGGANDGGLWSTGANWNSGAPAAGDNAIFATAFGSPTPDTSVNLNGNRTIANLTFSTTTSFSIDNNTLTINGTTSAINRSATSGTTTINSIVALGASQTWTSAAGGALVIGSGGVNLGTRTLTAAGGGAITISGNIGNTSGGVTRNGAGGTLTLSGSNTYTGATTVTAGTLELASVTALPISSAVTLNGGTLSITTVDQTYGNVFTVSTTASTIDVASGRTFTLGNAANDLAGSVGLTKAGAGNLSLGFSNSYSGAWTLTAGTLTSAASGALGTGNVSLNGGTLAITTVDQTYNQTFTLSTASTIDVASGRALTLGNAANDLTGAAGLTKTGAGNLILGFSNNYSGGWTITGGTVTSAAVGALGTGAVSLNGGTLAITTVDQTYSQVFTGSSASTIDVASGRTLTIGNAVNDLIGSAGITKNGTGNLALGFSNTYSGNWTLAAGTVTSSAAGALGTGDLTFGGGTLAITTVDQSYSQAITLSSTGIIDVASGRILTLGGNISGAGGITKNGTGTLVLSGASSSFTGTVGVGAGILNIQSSSALGAAGTGVTIASGAELQLQGGITVGAGENITSVQGTGTGSAGAIRNISGANAYNGTVTLAGATTIGSDAGTLSLGGDVNNAGFQLSFAGAGNTTVGGIVSGAGKLVAGGAGTLTLSGVNTYSGGTDFNAGTVVSTGTTGLGSGALTFGGGNLSVTTANQAYSQVVTLNATPTIDVGAGVTLSLTGVIGGAGGLTKSGNGTLVLNNANTYSGVTQITAGTVNIQNNTALGSTLAGVSIANNAELQLQGGITVGSGENVTSVQGTGFVGSGAIRNISGANTYNGTITLAGPTTIGSDAGTLSLAGNIANAGNALTIDGAGSTSISGVISGGGNLNKNGGGTLSLGGSGHSIGTLAVNSGALSVAANTTLSGISLSAASGASIQLNYTGSTSIPTLTLTGGTVDRVINSATATTLTLSTGLTSTGASTISNSGGGGSMSISGPISVNSGTLTLTPSSTGKIFLTGLSTVSLAAGATLKASGTGNFDISASRVFSGAGTGAGSEAKVDLSSAGITVNTSPARLDLSGSGSYGLRVEGKQASVDYFTAASTLAATTAGSAGTLTIAYTDAGSPMRTFGSSANPASGTYAKLGFDNAGSGSPQYFLGLSGDNQLSNWGGLVVKGGTVTVSYDMKFTGRTADGVRTTLDVLGGTLSLESVTDAKQLWLTGNINLQSGTVAGGSGGGGGGWIKGERDITIASGFTINNTPKIESAPGVGITANIDGTGSFTGSNQLGTFTKTGGGDTLLKIGLDATTALDLQGSGSFILNTSNLVGDSTPIKMAGATFKTGGNDDTVGTLTLSNNSYLDLGGVNTYGTDNSVLHFADSSTKAWNSSTLYILNWTGKDTVGTPTPGSLDEVYFGSSASGLTSDQVNQIIFVNPYIYSWGTQYVGNLPAIILPTGEVVPRIIPETRTVVLTSLLGLVGLFRERSRLRTLFQSLIARFRPNASRLN